MRYRLRLATRLASVGLLVAVAAAGAAVWWPRTAHAALVGYGRSDQPLAAATVPTPKFRFLISGSVGGMFPGSSRPLVLTISNPNKVRITVTSITTSIGNASTACPAPDFSVTAFTGSLVVRPFHTRSTTVVASMAHSAPDACQGAVFPLSYSGLGRAP